MFGSGGYSSGGYQNQRVPYKGQKEVTAKVGAAPMDGNSMPVKFGSKSKDPFDRAYDGEESKYRPAQSKPTGSRPAAKKPVPRNTGAKKNVDGENFVMGGGSSDVFGARPVLSSSKAKPGASSKTGAKPAKKNPKDPYAHVKPTISRRVPPFSGASAAAYARVEEADTPIRGGQGMPSSVQEYGDTGSLKQCKFCKRSFNEVSLMKHQNVCLERPGKRKRKVFDSSKMRIIDEEQRMLQAPSRRPEPKKQQPGKMPKWKAMSLQFRAGLKAARAAEKGLAPPPMPIQSSDGYEDPTKTKCPTCGRSFNNVAAQRHIPFCANKAREEALRCGGRPRGKPSKGQPKTQNKFGRR